MTILDVTKMWSRSSCGVTENGQQTDAKFTAAYQVLHSIDATDLEIISATGIPRTGDPIDPTMDYVTCDSVGPNQRGLNLSIVPVTFAGAMSASEIASSPLNAPPTMSYYSIASQEPAEVDGYGNPLVNTAGVPFVGNMRTHNDMELSIKRNFLAVNMPLMLQYLNSVNLDNLTIFGQIWQPGQAAMTQYNVQPMYLRNQISYFEVDSRIQFRVPYNNDPFRSWWYRYASMGTQQRGLEVQFTGGSGTGAAGYAITNSDKEITAIVVTSPGAGYTSAPTINIIGGGSGATFTVNLNSTTKSVASVTVTAGGSDYVSKLIPCLDGNKQPVTQPVALDSSGRQSNTAFIIERPEKPFLLNYSALGLI